MLVVKLPGEVSSGTGGYHFLQRQGATHQLEFYVASTGQWLTGFLLKSVFNKSWKSLHKVVLCFWHPSPALTWLGAVQRWPVHHAWHQLCQFLITALMHLPLTRRFLWISAVMLVWVVYFQFEPASEWGLLPFKNCSWKDTAVQLLSSSGYYIHINCPFTLCCLLMQYSFKLLGPKSLPFKCLMTCT